MKWLRSSWREACWANPFCRWLLFSLILAFSFALRAYLLGAQNLWWDEALAIWAVRKGFVPMTLWTASDVHPPLFFWSLFGITRLAGESEFAARFPSAIYGLLTVPFAYQLGRKLVNRSVGLGAALLLATARFHVWWSQEMRMYVLAGLCGTASLYFMVSWWKQEHQGARGAWKALLPYGLASVAALYTLYLSIFVIAVENAFVFFASLSDERSARWRMWQRWAVSQVAIFVLFAPWLALALPRMHTWSTATPFDFGSFLQLYWAALSLGISTHVERYTLVALAFLMICLVTPLTSLRNGRDRSAILLLLLCLVLPPIAVYLLSMPRGLFYSPKVEARYLLPFAAPFYVLLAWSLWLLWRRKPPIGLLISGFVFVAYVWSLPQHYAGRYLRDELQTMVRVILAYAEDGDAVCVISGNRYPIFEYYYYDPARGGSRPPVHFLPNGVDFLSAGNMEEQLAPVVAPYSRIWLALVDSTLQDPEGLAKEWFDKRYHALMSYGFAHNQLYLYAKDASPPRISVESLDPDYILQWDLPSAGTLVGYDLPTKEYRPGDTVHLGLYWRNPKPASILLEMQDARGHVLERRAASLAERDAADIIRQQFDFPIYPRTPAGRYHFRLSVADADMSAEAAKEFGELFVSKTLPLPRGERMDQPLSLTLGSLARLEGFSLRSRGRSDPVAFIRPGDILQLTLYWRALQKMEERYTVFTHLVGEAYNPASGGPLWGQHDSEPLEGGLPTTQWFVGQLIVDEHLIPVSPEAPPGEYELEVGLYYLPTGERLQVQDADGNVIGNRVLLGRWPVRASR